VCVTLTLDVISCAYSIFAGVAVGVGERLSNLAADMQTEFKSTASLKGKFHEINNA